MVVSLNESALLVHQENVLLATSETCFQFFPWNQFLTQCSLASQVNTITEKKKTSRAKLLCWPQFQYCSLNPVQLCVSL